MRIAILSCFHPYRGGIAQFNTALYSVLSKTNEVKAFNFKRQYPDILFPGKSQYVSNPDKETRMESERILDTVNFFSWKKTANAILDWGPDVLIMRYWMSWFALPLGYVASYVRKRGVKVIAIADNVFGHEKTLADSMLSKYFFRQCSGCVTLCEAVKEQLAEIVPEKPVTVLYHPLYTHFGNLVSKEEARAKLGIAADKKILLFFGLIRDYKGLDLLLGALAGLDETYELIIAGEPYGSFGRYQRLIDGNNLSKRVHSYLHFIGDDDVKYYFCASDVAVLPYRSATQSGVSSVAFHFDLPMITTLEGGLKESIIDTGCGISCESPCISEVRNAISRYFSDSSIEAGCKEAISRMKEDLSWSNFAARLLEFTDSLNNSR